MGGRRPSVLQRWGGDWGSPQTVSGCAQGATGNRAVGGVKGRRSRPLQGPLCEIERSEM